MGTWEEITDKAKSVASNIKEKLSESLGNNGVWNTLKSYAKSTVEWVKEKINNFKNRGEEMQVENNQQLSGQSTLDFDDHSSYEQNTCNLAVLYLAKDSALASKDRVGFDQDKVEQQASDFLDYYAEYDSIDLNSENADAEIQALNDKYGADTVEIFNRATQGMQEYQANKEAVAKDALNSGLSQEDAAKKMAQYIVENADAAYAAGDMPKEDYDAYLKANNMGLVGLASEVYASKNGLSLDTEEQNAQTDEPVSSLSDTEYKTNINLDNTVFDTGDDIKNDYMKIAVLKAAENCSTNGAVDPERFALQMNIFSKYYDDYNKLTSENHSDEEFTEKLDELNKTYFFESDSEPLVMFNDGIQAVGIFNEIDAKYSEFSDALAETYDKTDGLSEDKQIAAVSEFIKNYEDPDIAYGVGCIDYEEYNQLLKEPLLMFNDKESYNTYMSKIEKQTSSDNSVRKQLNEEASNIVDDTSSDTYDEYDNT